MSVIIDMETPQFLPHLVDGLSAAGCSARRISASACRVVHDDAADAREELFELRFFVGAWAHTHGAGEVRLRREA